MFFAVYISALNKSCINLMEPLFVILIALLLSQCTVTAKLESRICTVLGSISMPMFTFHWCVGSVCIFVTSNMKLRILIYYTGTLIIGLVWFIVHYYLQIRRYNK